MSELSATEILAIPLSQPHKLFPGDRAQAVRVQRKLSAKWHPDRNADGAAVMAHINALFDKALERIENGTWVGPSLLRLHEKNGKVYELRYQKASDFELGRVYVATRFVVYVVQPQFADLAANAIRMISRLHYRDDAMRAEHSRYMPKIESVVHMASGETAVVIAKKPEQVMLSDVLQHFGSMEPRHVAWILSSLYNVACYLKWAGINHNDIGAHSYFVSAKDHNGALLGGWWYAAETGRKPLAVPARTRRASKEFTSKAVDGSLIRMTGLELLGPQFKAAPDPMKRWLRGIGDSNTFHEYQAWADMLVAAFGARRYAELKLPAEL